MRTIGLSLFLCMFSWLSVAADDIIQDCYTVKIAVTHDGNGNKQTWATMAAKVTALVDYFNEEDKTEYGATRESFSIGLLKAGDVFKEVYALAKNDGSFAITIDLFNEEVSPTTDNGKPSPNGHEMLEMTLLFKREATSAENKSKIDALMANYLDLCISHQEAAAIDSFGPTMQQVFELSSGHAYNYIGVFEKPMLDQSN